MQPTSVGFGLVRFGIERTQPTAKIRLAREEKDTAFPVSLDAEEKPYDLSSTTVWVLIRRFDISILNDEIKGFFGKMFEGLVQKLLLGYLGRYIKDIQREQLKITVWNGIHSQHLCIGFGWDNKQFVLCNLQRKSCWRTWSWFLKRLTICSCLLLLSKVCDINGFIFFFRKADDAFNFYSLFVLTGRVGKLSIKVPWKKIGWEPIIIKLEDVFISATQRSDQEVTFFFYSFFFVYNT